MVIVEELSRRERQIMEVVYARGGARGAGGGGVTAEEVVGGLADPPTRTAVRTFLRILEEKGLVRHEKRGRAFVYMPVRPAGVAGKSAFRRVVETFFGGSLERALAAHLTDPSAKLSEEEYGRLVEVIGRAKRK